MEVEPLASIYGWIMKQPYKAYVFFSPFYGWFLWVQSLFCNQTFTFNPFVNDSLWNGVVFPIRYSSIIYKKYP